LRPAESRKISAGNPNKKNAKKKNILELTRNTGDKSKSVLVLSSSLMKSGNVCKNKPKKFRTIVQNQKREMYETNFRNVLAE